MAEFASNAKGNAALATGIIGTAGVGLGLLNGMGGLGNLFGGGKRKEESEHGTELALAALMMANATHATPMCNETINVNRYEAAQQARIAELETEVKLRDANTFTMGEMNKLRDYVDGKFAHVESELCNQRVYNATLNSTVGCISAQIAQLMSLTKIVVPNTSVCPGWGDVTVSVTPTTTTGA